MLFSLCATAFAAYTDAQLEAFGLGGYTPNEIANDQVSRNIALDSYVLLENNGVLPLKNIEKVALFGNGATGTVKGGTGSGIVNQRERDWIDSALEDAGIEITTPMAYRNAVGRGVVATGFSGSRMCTDVNITDAWLEEAKAADTAIYVFGRNAGEGSDRRLDSGDGQWYLTNIERANLEKVAANFENVIVVMNTMISDVTWYKEIENIDALLHIGYGGQKTGATTVQVLTGEVTPSGKTAATWAWELTDYSSTQAGFSNLYNSPTVTEYYEEGIYVGYRYFDTFGVDVAYPFGYGLSYTDFEIDVTNVSIDEEEVAIDVKVANVGNQYSGKEVIQVYFSAPDGKLEKPYQELAAYGKTDTLAPGQIQKMTITFPTADMSSYDEESAAYILEAGDYYIRVGNCSRNTHVVAAATLAETVITEQLSNQLALEDGAVLNEISKKGATPITYPGEAAEKAAAKANATVLDVETLEGLAVNNASPYDDETITTYLFAADAENYTPRKGITISTKTVNGIIQNGTNPAGPNFRGHQETTYDEVVEIVPDLPAGITKDNAKLTDVVEGRITLQQFVACLSNQELARLAYGAGGVGGVGRIYDDDGKLVATSSALPGNVGRTTEQLFASRHIPVLGYCDGPAGIRCDQNGVVSPRINNPGDQGGTYFTSNDGGITVFSGSSSNVNLDQSFNVEGSGRYVKLTLSDPGTQYGFSIYEFEIYTYSEVTGQYNVAVGKDATAKTEATSDRNLIPYVNDGNTGTRWGADYRNGDTVSSWVQIDLGQTYPLSRMRILFEAAYANNYIVEVSNDGQNFTKIYDTKEATPSDEPDPNAPITYHVYPTAFPCSSNLACTWNEDVIYSFGYALGAEQEEYHVGAWLAPGMNIVRNPMCGRNFEYYSEDPLVTGITAANVTAGVQAHKGGGVTIKHYWANNQEQARNNENNVISERAAREIYLKGYEIAIKKAQPLFLMTSYNENNGWPAGDSYDSCTDLARGEWGFNGLIMTDWNGGQSSPHVSMHGGNDMITPGSSNTNNIMNYLGITAPTFNADGSIRNAGSFVVAAGGSETYITPTNAPSEDNLPASVRDAIAAEQARYDKIGDDAVLFWYGNHYNRIVRGDVQKSALNILGVFLYSIDMQRLCADLGVDYSAYEENFSAAMGAPMADEDYVGMAEKSAVKDAGIVADTVTVDAVATESLAVPVTYTGDDAITSVRLYIDSALPIADIESENDFEFNSADGWIVIYNGDGGAIDHALFNIIYDLEPTIPDGEYPIDLTLVDVTGADALSTDAVAIDGAVIIDNNYPKGDVSQDGEVTNADLIMIARYLVHLVEFNDKQMEAADYNNDGDVTNTDLVLIARAIVAG